MCLKTLKRNVHTISSTINNGYKPYTQIFCKLGEEKDRHSSNKEIKKRYGMELLQKKTCTEFLRLRFPFWPRLNRDPLDPDANVLNVTVTCI